ncbi:unnamed protein product [Schistosoma rodhaini]|uniref:SCP domain-containing protein n=1 Tax=Schistosoma rodhaini TaxID=6188 RepID=A0AA85GDG5_9TREM|nr:unnamed protein product [Schistosoma rodhaini]
MFLREKNVTLVVHILMILVNMIYANGGLDAKSEELLNLHRKYRQDLVDCKVDGQPPAKYMSPLKWNHDLARQAQSLANQCILRHDKRYSKQFSWVGQNIALHPTIKSGNWNNEKPYEVKPRHMCPMMQNIPQNSLQTSRAHTQHGQKPLTQSEKRVSTNVQNEGRDCNQREQSRSRY